MGHESYIHTRNIQVVRQGQRRPIPRSLVVKHIAEAMDSYVEKVRPTKCILNGALNSRFMQAIVMKSNDDPLRFGPGGIQLRDLYLLELRQYGRTFQPTFGLQVRVDPTIAAGGPLPSMHVAATGPAIAVTEEQAARALAPPMPAQTTITTAVDGIAARLAESALDSSRFLPSHSHYDVSTEDAYLRQYPHGADSASADSVSSLQYLDYSLYHTDERNPSGAALRSRPSVHRLHAPLQLGHRYVLVPSPNCMSQHFAFPRVFIPLLTICSK